MMKPYVFIIQGDNVDNITIKVSELQERIKQILANKMEYVELSVLDEDKMDDGEIIPRCLSLSATNDGFEYVDYDEIDETIISKGNCQDRVVKNIK